MLKRISFITAALAMAATGLFAQKAAGEAQAKAGPPRPDPLVFREAWTAPTNDHVSVSQKSIGNPSLELKLFGAGLSMDTVLENDGPLHLWTGNCMQPCAATLRDKEHFVDMTGLARIRWTVKVSGFHKVQPILRLADGTYLIGDMATGSVIDFQDVEFWIKDVRWMKLDAEHLAPKGFFLPNPDLSRVDAVGFVDLMVGAGHGPGAYADVGKIEVYGKAVARPSTHSE